MKEITTVPIAFILTFLTAPLLLQAQSCTTDITNLCVKSGVNVVVRFNIAGDYSHQWKKYNPNTQAWENHGNVSVNTGLGACGWFENNSYIPKQEKYRIEAGKMADRPHLIMKHS